MQKQFDTSHLSPRELKTYQAGMQIVERTLAQAKASKGKPTPPARTAAEIHAHSMEEGQQFNQIKRMIAQHQRKTGGEV